MSELIGHTTSEAKPLSDTDLFAALTQVKVFTPMLAQALADHIGYRAQQISRMREALEKIAEGRGPFSIDQLTFASNVIETMKQTAREALSDDERSQS